MQITRKLFVLFLILMFLVVACESSSSDTADEAPVDNPAPAASNGNPGNNPTPVPPGAPVFRIVSGSENRSLEPLIMQYASENGLVIQIDYLGSLDIKLLLERGDQTYDAVWPANSLWLTIGDTNRMVRHEESILRSPVVMGVKRSVAEELGWIDTPVYVADILEAAEERDLSFMMTSATQSNSGSSAYFGYLYALANKETDTLLTMEDLQDPQLQEQITRILSTVDRSSSSSGFLKDLFIREYDKYDAMVNYEALIIEANQELIIQEREPLYVIYPVDGLAIADSPLGYVDQGNDEKEQIFLGLQEYLLSPDVQAELLARGRRVGIGQIQNADPAVFNPDWGIDPDRIISPIRFPGAEVIEEALNLYQTAFRKNSYTIYILDYSGSMGAEVGNTGRTGEVQLEDAMQTMLNQALASEYLLQAAPGDVTIVIPFSDDVLMDWELSEWTVEGNDAEAMQALYEQIEALSPVGGTNIYNPTITAIEIMEQVSELRNYFPAIILMTDGETTSGTARFPELQQAIDNSGLDIPIFTIMFGQAVESEVVPIANYTAGRVYDGRNNLIDAFRSAKGNN